MRAPTISVCGVDFSIVVVCGAPMTLTRRCALLDFKERRKSLLWYPSDLVVDAHVFVFQLDDMSEHDVASAQLSRRSSCLSSHSSTTGYSPLNSPVSLRRQVQNKFTYVKGFWRANLWWTHLRAADRASKLRLFAECVRARAFAMMVEQCLEDEKKNKWAWFFVSFQCCCCSNMWKETVWLEHCIHVLLRVTRNQQASIDLSIGRMILGSNATHACKFYLHASTRIYTKFQFTVCSVNHLWRPSLLRPNIVTKNKKIEIFLKLAKEGEEEKNSVKVSIRNLVRRRGFLYVVLGQIAHIAVCALMVFIEDKLRWMQWLQATVSVFMHRLLRVCGRVHWMAAYWRASQS